MQIIAEIKDPVKRFFTFCKERHNIYTKRLAGKPPPWTRDEVLQNYRFCNLYRERDKVTEWITDNWRTPNASDPDLWFALCVARLLNQPECLDDLGYPVPWDRRAFLTKLKQRERAGKRVFNAAYIVATGGISINKVVYIADYILEPMWKQRKQLAPRPGDTLNSYHMVLGQMAGFGSFMSGQIVADMKHEEPLKSASDWWTFAASGPGSRRGLNFILGRDRKSAWTEENWRFELARLKQKIDPMIAEAGMPPLCSQNLQNGLCEYSKIHRAWYEGKMPKQLYRGGK